MKVGENSYALKEILLVINDFWSVKAIDLYIQDIFVTKGPGL